MPSIYDLHVMYMMFIRLKPKLVRGSSVSFVDMLDGIRSLLCLA